ncbi:unnamed protein product [Trichogramma brassicae]|uniref:Integrase zinc-binding domain-containing protein n=1 Tax=Trichogramma brassicae TaxID=86971 RepID=A0A6H5J475_9HYME|nr:unnamed protein product [Trichogramma brassicae]
MSRRSPPLDEVFQRVIHLPRRASPGQVHSGAREGGHPCPGRLQPGEGEAPTRQQSLAHTQRALQETLQQLNDLRGKKREREVARERARTTAAEKIKERKLRRRFLKYFGTEEPTSTWRSTHHRRILQEYSRYKPVRRSLRTPQSSHLAVTFRDAGIARVGIITGLPTSTKDKAEIGKRRTGRSRGSDFCQPHIGSATIGDARLLLTRVEVRGAETIAALDSGATHNYVKPHLVKGPLLPAPSRTDLAAMRVTAELTGRTKMTFQARGQSFTIEASFNSLLNIARGGNNELPDQLIPESVRGNARGLRRHRAHLATPLQPKAVEEEGAGTGDRALGKRHRGPTRYDPRRPALTIRIHRTLTTSVGTGSERNLSGGDHGKGPPGGCMCRQQSAQSFCDSTTTQPKPGHPGSDETHRALQRHFYWRGMQQDVRSHIRDCNLCGRVKKASSHPAPISSHTPTEPWKHVALDLMGPYPTTGEATSVNPRHHRLVLAMGGDIPGASSRRHHDPGHLGEGNLPEMGISTSHPNRQWHAIFSSKKWTETLQRWQITPWTTAVYHPRANPTERRNQEIKTALRLRLADREQ